jgi:hypothetical protein
MGGLPEEWVVAVDRRQGTERSVVDEIVGVRFQIGEIDDFLHGSVPFSR